MFMRLNKKEDFDTFIRKFLKIYSSYGHLRENVLWINFSSELAESSFFSETQTSKIVS